MEIDFGYFWKRKADPDSYYRVSWAEEDGELYAVSRNFLSQPAERRHLSLASGLTKEEAERLMDGWAEPHSEIYRDLDALIARLRFSCPARFTIFAYYAGGKIPCAWKIRKLPQDFHGDFSCGDILQGRDAVCPACGVRCDQHFKEG